MQNKNIRPTLSRQDNTNFVRQLFNTRMSNFGIPLCTYITKVADETEKMFKSRYRSIVFDSSQELQEQCEVAWHMALLGLAQQYGGLSFEDIMDHSHIEIAGGVYLLNTDMRQPMDQRVWRHASLLSQASNMVKIAAFTRTITTITTISENTEFKKVSADDILELAWLLKEFRVFSQWSSKAQTAWFQAGDVVNSWALQGLLKRSLPQPSLHFSLDDDLRISKLKELFSKD